VVNIRGRKLPVLPDKWSRDNENGSKVRYLERQQELQVNMTKFAKILAIKKWLKREIWKGNMARDKQV
jgi:hypothetical protein